MARRYRRGLREGERRLISGRHPPGAMAFIRKCPETTDSSNRGVWTRCDQFGSPCRRR
ncbi:protein of unknown function [Rhodovastum atsumiense]|nr:protein of unknown function [Rhodovastum atsumiense]